MARNNGIAIAKGDYILMPDSDDLLVENSLKPLLDKAFETKADIIVADYLIMNDEKIKALKSGEPKQEDTFSYQELTGEVLFLNYLNDYECFVWRALYRHEFLTANQIKFVQGIRYEDVPFTHEAYLKAKKCIRASWLLYIYRIGREGAITNRLDLSKAKDWSIAIGKTWDLLHIEGLSPEVNYKLLDNIHNSVIALIYGTIYTMPQMADRLKVINMLRREVPEMNFSHGLMQKAETIQFWHAPRLYISLRYCMAKQYKWRRRLIGR